MKIFFQCVPRVLERLVVVLVEFSFVLRNQSKLRRFRIAEDTKQGVEIFRGDRVVFVVVALRAGHRQRKEPARRRVDPVVVALGVGAQRVEPPPTHQPLAVIRIQ